MRARRCSATVVLPLPALPSTSSGWSAGAEIAAYCSGSRSAVMSAAGALGVPMPTPRLPGRAAVPAPPSERQLRADRGAPVAVASRSSSTPSPTIRRSAPSWTTTIRRATTIPSATRPGNVSSKRRPRGSDRRSAPPARPASRRCGCPPRHRRTSRGRGGSRRVPPLRRAADARCKGPPPGAAGAGSGARPSAGARSSRGRSAGRSSAEDATASSRSERSASSGSGGALDGAPQSTLARAVERHPYAGEEGFLLRHDRPLVGG